MDTEKSPSGKASQTAPGDAGHDRKIKVVALLQDLLFGGTQRQALELLRRMDRNRFQVELWTLLPGDDFAPLAREWDIPVRALTRGRITGPGCLARLWRLSRSEKVDVLMPMTVVPNIWGRIIGRLAGVRAVIGSCRGGGAEFRQYERFLWRLTKQIVSNSKNLRDSMVENCGVPPEHVSVVPNGVDLEFFGQARETRLHRAPSSNLEILCLARFSDAKDQATLVRAFSMVADRHPAATLRMLGDGPTQEQVSDLARELFGEGWSARVKIEPAQLDVREALGSADIFALASHRESLPNVILEAMAAWLPVVASDVGGIGEVVEHDVTGMLVPPEDPRAFAKALDKLLGAPALLASMGQAGRTRVEGCSFEAMTRSFEKIILKALS